MGVPTSEVGYTSAMPRREDHEVRKGHVGHWIKKKNFMDFFHCLMLKNNKTINKRVCFRDRISPFAQTEYKVHPYSSGPNRQSYCHLLGPEMMEKFLEVKDTAV